MHELSMTQELLDAAVQHARGRTITDVYVAVGELSSIMDDSLRFYWDMVSPGTLAAGASLHFRRVPAVLRCLDCGHTFAPDAGTLACPGCGSLGIKLTAGDSLHLEALDLAGDAARPGEALPSAPELPT
jgi:hydrogenase nickel incorporation protein HypA/HybF